jgi:dynein heavy chain
MRVFCDRLIDSTDKDLIRSSVIPDVVNEFFADVQEPVMKDPIILVDFIMSNPNDPEAEDVRLYEDLGEFYEIKEKLVKMHEEYDFENKPMNLVLFNDALEHVTKIHRTRRFPKGCGLLVGFRGSGK